MKSIKEKKYYKLMNNFDKSKNIKKDWYKCFKWILKDICPAYSDEVVNSLFKNFTMDNWKALHKENTEYKDETKDELFESFRCECIYISDRWSYDRLFRTHWIYLTWKYEDKRKKYEKEGE